METGSFGEYLKFFVALLAVINPVGTVPIFINLTEAQTKAGRNQNGMTAAFAMGLILAVVLFSGEAILRFFGISVGSFRVGGGILILLMAVSMLQAKLSGVKQTKEEAQDSTERESVGVVPLATPLLAGPGAISTVILYAQRYSSWLHSVYLLVVILLLSLLTLVLFRVAPTLSDWLGKTGINIVTRLMGLIMAAMGVEFMANGLKELFPVLMG